MIFSTTTLDPDTVYAVDLPETLRDASVRAQSPGYRFWSYPGRLTRNARRPATAQDLDQVLGALTLASDGTLAAMAADGTMKPVPIPAGKDGKDGTNGTNGTAGKDGLMRALKRGAVTTGKDGEALISYAELGLTAAPVLAIDPPIAAVPVRWRLKAAASAVAVTVVVTEDKPALLATLGVTVALSGGQPSQGAVVGYRVYPPETP